MIVFAFVLLCGWRYTRRPSLATSVGLGAVSGAMQGATSVGGPLVILYLLSGPDQLRRRAPNLTLYLAVCSLIGVVVLWHQGVFDAHAAWTSVALTPGYYAGLVSRSAPLPALQ